MLFYGYILEVKTVISDLETLDFHRVTVLEHMSLEYENPYLIDSNNIVKC